MKKYRIPCYWEQYGEIEVEAKSLEEALDLACGPETPLPPEGTYIEGSFTINYDMVEALNDERLPG